MASQITFFRKNRLDTDFDNVAISATEGDGFTDYLRNRNLTSGWATTGSVDANETEIIFDLTDPFLLDSFILVNHNFASFGIERWNAATAAFEDFEDALFIEDNLETTTHLEFPLQLISRFRLIIYGTIEPDDDKYMANFIATAKIGQLEGWPIIKAPVISRARKKLTMLSGKTTIRENIGFTAFKLDVAIWNIDSDLTIVESLYDANEGFHVRLAAGDEEQFSHRRRGYRLEDIPLMKCQNEYGPEWNKGLYKSGMKISIDLTEVVE